MLALEPHFDLILVCAKDVLFIYLFINSVLLNDVCNAVFIYLIILVEFRVFYMIYVDKCHVVCNNILLSGLFYYLVGWVGN